MPANTTESVAAPVATTLVSIDDWAATLKLSRRTIERMRSSGEIPPPDVNRRRRPRWFAATMEEWLRSGSKKGA